jgi:DNA-binding helix-hairpin-helix protein with protein kinase domain
MESQSYKCLNRTGTFHLTDEIKSGGEGKILSTSIEEYVAKIYHKELDGEKIKKLRFMIENPPHDPMKSKGHTSIAWPVDLVIESNTNKTVGFLMPKISSNCVTLVNVYNQKLRVKKSPEITWLSLHMIAQNVAAVVNAIHREGYVIGDIKPDNFLVNKKTLVVTIVDTDSFQVVSKDGCTYYCQVMTPDYAAPELQDNATRSNKLKTEKHDYFSLGIVIHQILFGVHPFVKKESADENSSSSLDDSRQRSITIDGEYYAKSESRIRKRKHLIPPNIIHSKIQQYFKKCFDSGQTNPSFRPNAKRWATALQEAMLDLIVCTKNKNHRYDKKDKKCYWCQAQIEYFPASKSMNEKESDVSNTSDSADVLNNASGNTSVAQVKTEWKHYRIPLVVISALILVALIFCTQYFFSNTDNSSTTISIAELNQLKELNTYIKQKIKHNSNFKGNVQYLLKLDKGGRVISLSSTTKESSKYLDSIGFIKIGDKVVESYGGINRQDYRVNLNLDNLVDGIKVEYYP